MKAKHGKFKNDRREKLENNLNLTDFVKIVSAVSDARIA